MRTLVVISLVLITAVAFAESATDALEKEYKGKIVQLRQPQCGSKLHYDANWTPAIKNSFESWTVCGQLQVESFATEDGQLVLKGRRLYLVFNEVTKKMEDVEDALRDPTMFQSLDKKEREAALKDERKALNSTRPLKITFGSDTVGPDEALRLMRIFSQDADVATLPDAWRDAFEGRPIFDSTMKRSSVLRVGGAVKAPEIVKDPAPDYSDTARDLKFGGRVVLWLVVDESGSPETVRIVKPLGLGLDEQAVEAVQGWKFKPAEKDGKPVAVQLNIEVTFRLY